MPEGNRSKGITIRNTVDCLIAAVAIENNARLLHNDRDFDFIAQHFPLRIIIPWHQVISGVAKTDVARFTKMSPA